MSTKHTIAHGEDFHLYRDAFEDGHVFLRIDNGLFEASPDGVTVRLPLHVWEYLRTFPGAELAAAQLSDEQIEQEAIAAVEARLARVSASPPGQRGLIELGGAFSMGPADLPREEQIRHMAEQLKREREKQRAVLARIDALKK